MGDGPQTVADFREALTEAMAMGDIDAMTMLAQEAFHRFLGVVVDTSSQQATLLRLSLEAGAMTRDLPESQGHVIGSLIEALVWLVDITLVRRVVTHQ